MAADIHNLYADQKAQLERLKRSFDNGGEPPDDNGMEARVAKLEADVSAIKVDVATIRSNYATKADIADIRTDMHKATTDIQRWMIATIIGLFLGFGGLFMAMSNSLKPSSPAPQAAPIIIAVPAAPNAPGAAMPPPTRAK